MEGTLFSQRQGGRRQAGFKGGSLSRVSLAHQQTGRRSLILPDRWGADAVFLTFPHPNLVRVNASLECVNATSFIGKYMFNFIAPTPAITPSKPV